MPALRGRPTAPTAGGAGAQALAERLGGRVLGEPSPGRPRDWSDDLPSSRPVLEAAAAEISAALDQAELPLLTASDCSICIATMPTVARRVPGVRFLWIDAHGDFNTPGDDAQRLPRRHVPGRSLRALGRRLAGHDRRGVGSRSSACATSTPASGSRSRRRGCGPVCRRPARSTCTSTSTGSTRR